VGIPGIPGKGIPGTPYSIPEGILRNKYTVPRFYCPQIYGGKEAAKWENALNELEENGLVVARGYKGEVFELTYQG
jgi:hypothetical protein